MKETQNKTDKKNLFQFVNSSVYMLMLRLRAMSVACVVVQIAFAQQCRNRNIALLARNIVFASCSRAIVRKSYGTCHLFVTCQKVFFFLSHSFFQKLKYRTAYIDGMRMYSRWYHAMFRRRANFIRGIQHESFARARATPSVKRINIFIN